MTDMVLFFATDDAPKFGFKHCTDATLYDTVREFMFPGHIPTQDMNDELAGIVDRLRETGSMDFEDGWLCTRTGIVDVVAFLMAKVSEECAEAKHSDRWRYEEMRARQAAELKYANLRAALIEALGDKAPKVFASAAE